jgi:hypothetical protein
VRDDLACELREGSILDRKLGDQRFPLQQGCREAQVYPLTPGRATLCALGEYLRMRCFFAPLHERGKIVQKVVNYRPTEKLLDGLFGMLCGAKTISQSNLTSTVAAAVQRAFEHKGCAEPSTIARDGCNHAIPIDHERGGLHGGSDHRNDGCAIGY